MVVDQRPHPRFDIAPTSLDGVQFIFLLKVTGDLVEAFVASHGHLVLLASDPETPVGIPAWRGAEYEKVFQIAALFVLASSGQHHLAEFVFASSFLLPLPSPCIQVLLRGGLRARGSPRSQRKNVGVYGRVASGQWVAP